MAIATDPNHRNGHFGYWQNARQCYEPTCVSSSAAILASSMLRADLCQLKRRNRRKLELLLTLLLTQRMQLSTALDELPYPNPKNTIFVITIY